MTLELWGGPCDGERLEYGRFTTAQEAIRRHLADEWVCGRQFSGTYVVATEAMEAVANPWWPTGGPARAYYEQDSAALRGRETS